MMEIYKMGMDAQNNVEWKMGTFVKAVVKIL